MSEQMRIEIGANVTSAVTGLQAVSQAAAKTTQSLKVLPNTTNQATFALSNLSRVAQDAPYGFIGIANNLNPLLESFQRLKATTGTTGSALKAMAATLTGPAGIGLALGVVSSLLVVFGDKIFGASKETKRLREESKQLQTTLLSLSKPVNELKEGFIASAEQEIATVRALSTVVLDQTKSYNERNNALKRLEGINKEYFGSMTVETAALGKLKSAVDEYSNAIIANAVVKGFSDEIGKVSVELSKQIINYNKAGREVDRLARENERLEKSVHGSRGEIESAEQALGKNSSQLRSAKQNLSNFGSGISELTGQMTDLRTSLQGAVNDSLKFKPLTASTGEKKDSTSEIISRAKRINDAYKNIIDLKLDIRPDDKVKEQFKKAVEYLEKYGKSQYQLINIYATGKLNIEDIDFPEAEKVVKDNRDDAERLRDLLGKEYTDYFKQNPIDPTIAVSLKKVALEDKQKGFLKGLFNIDTSLDQLEFTELEKSAIQTAQAINGVLSTAFDSLFDAIQSGKDPIQSFFKGVMQGITQLIKKLISAAIAAAILSAILPGSLLGKMGVKGFGGIFKGLLGFASGGRPPLGRPSLIGERGPELFVPDSPGTIIPNHQLSNNFRPSSFVPSNAFGGTNISGGSIPQGSLSVALNGTLEASGNTLVALINRVVKANTRLSGKNGLGLA